MPILVKEAGLFNKNLTNHCIRSTCITILDREGYEARHIMAISGHKKEESIKSYASKTSRSTKRQISETLSNVLALSPKKFKVPTTQNHIYTKQKCSEIVAQGNKRDDDHDDKPNFDLGLADLLEISPEEEQNIMNQIFADDMPIPDGNEKCVAKPFTNNQCNTVNTFNPMQQMQQVVPK